MTSAPRARSLGAATPATPDRDGLAAELPITWTWWMNPFWPVLLLVAGTAAFSIGMSADVYAQWHTAKRLDTDAATGLAAGVLAVLIGMLFASGMSRRGGTASVQVTWRQVDFLARTYRVTLALTVFGYAVWFATAYGQGVGPDQLTAVLGRESGAISSLKESARPLGGVTTTTQFGPVAVALGVLLRRLGFGGRSFYLLFPLALARTLFYAERLALLELLVPACIVAALTISPVSRWRMPARLLPVVTAPIVYLIFAASEYGRSWVYYQTTTDQSFAGWALTRMLGYYTTSYNNSALLEDAVGHGQPTYFTFQGFWEFPPTRMVSGDRLIGRSPPTEWWEGVLLTHATPEFNNTGSFLMVRAEFGWIGMILLFLVVGLLLGNLYSRMTFGSVPALIALPTVFLGALELPRILYWTQGRCVPILVALVVIALCYPRASAGYRPASVGVTDASEPAPFRTSR